VICIILYLIINCLQKQMLEVVFEVEFISIFCYVIEVRTLLIPTKLTSGTLYFKDNYGIVIM